MSADDYLAMHKANSSHFSLDISGIPDGLLNVIGFNSQNDNLCDDYQFEINIVSSAQIEPEMVLNKAMSLNLAWSMSNRKISGLVSGYTARGQDSNGYHYILMLNSYFWRLKKYRSNRVFTNQSASQIINAVFNNAQYPMAKLSLSIADFNIDMIVQYDETDYEFITRFMRKYGFVYGYIENDLEPEVLHICDSSETLAGKSEQVSLGYKAPTGNVRNSESIFAFSRQAVLTTNDFVYDDYNYESVQNLHSETNNLAQQIGFGTSNHWGENYKDTDQGEELALIRQQSHDCARDIIIIDTDCRAIRPGMTINVTDHTDYDGKYLVIKVHHLANQGQGVEYGMAVKGLTYKNQVTLLPASITYKAPLLKNKRVFATFNATIAQGVDDKGEYQVNLPFNQNGLGEPSKQTRLLQPYGGAGHGMHFPYEAGTEVLVCGENGDLDRPVILGALYNANAPSPVNANNAHENKLVTRSGNTLLMDDKQGEEKISLGTLDDNNALILDATHNQHSATLQSVEGEMFISAKNAIQLVSQKDVNITAKGDLNTLAENSINVQTTEGDISFTSASDLHANAQSNIRLQALDGSTEIQAVDAIKLQAGQDVSLYVEQGNLEMQAPEGDINIQANANLTIKGNGNGAIEISQSGASIVLDAGGNLTIDANNISLSAGNIVIKGNAISNN
ncbi:type VI secretion system Vgr family protein [Pseudoalteromonas denitrificans]|uniref:Type VI secretion system secreted protein VgrG n=1 Tax=Pseudoalteromonas denitrificans DSM 6059 TaxID=1123010 RepID=A0A1I1NE19_9GAMM|nr:type VI secretion system tip protein TssI/VgrG [Pseudoalteromonas denitrificans]SFC95869.1 hypothetical protein SAMN02745724_03039 [Pseudoalteromonas denitrificans DSM 6059]